MKHNLNFVTLLRRPTLNFLSTKKTVRLSSGTHTSHHPHPPRNISFSFLTRRRPRDNLHQLTRDDGLPRAIVQDLKSVDHVAGVLGRVVHCVAAGGDLAGVAFGEGPEEGVGEGVFLHVPEDFIVDFEGGEVRCVGPGGAMG